MTETSDPSVEHPQVAIARSIATEKHASQTDKLGMAYIHHPRRVATSLEDPSAQAVGWLHDVIEDCKVLAEELLAAGLDENIVKAVVQLTRTAEVSDDLYYARIAANPLARSVKLADIADNLLAWRTERLDPDKREKLARKYAKARLALGAEADGDTRGSCHDRAAGVIVGMAAGDALGAPYEFQPPFGADFIPVMSGGGVWEAGEWTDDTAMAVPILQAAADGKELDDDAVLDGIVASWIGWSRNAKDVGIQLGQVLRSATAPTAAASRVAAQAVHDANGKSAGNGSLMRTAPVALAYLDDEDGLIAAARRLSDLTHLERDAGDACVIWCLAIRHAILNGELNLRRGIVRLPAERHDLWHARLDEAEAHTPDHFAKNGWVVEALQGAWSAISTTPVPRTMSGRHLRLGLEAAVRGGRDADTVAAIAGSLLGARWSVSAIPSSWKRKLHGWPGLATRDLVRLAVLAVDHGKTDSQGWPSAPRVHVGPRTLVRHPHDDGVWLGALGALDQLPAEIDAVVSLCRIGTQQTDRESVEVWLVDKSGFERNANLDLVLTDAADVIGELRSEGKTVLVHCFAAQSRTPSVGALYSVRHLGIHVEKALREVIDALPDADPAPFLQTALGRIASAIPF